MWVSYNKGINGIDEFIVKVDKRRFVISTPVDSFIRKFGWQLETGRVTKSQVQKKLRSVIELSNFIEERKFGKGVYTDKRKAKKAIFRAELKHQPLLFEI